MSVVDAVAHEETCAWRSTSSSNLGSHNIDMRHLYHVCLNPGSLMPSALMAKPGPAEKKLDIPSSVSITRLEQDVVLFSYGIHCISVPPATGPASAK